MMTNDDKPIDSNFADRIARIEGARHGHKHGLGRGKGGLVPVKTNKQRREVNIVPLALLFVMGMMFKAFVYANDGRSVYNARVEPMMDGNVVERAAAWLLHADPVTIAIAQMMPVI